jgi:hypothetical protein
MMALDGEDITQITQIIRDQNNEQFDRLSEKLELTVLPIKENLANHTAHDEKIHENMYEKLDDLSTGQTRLKSNMGVISVFGSALLTIATGLIIAVLKGMF